MTEPGIPQRTLDELEKKRRLSHIIWFDDPDLPLMFMIPAGTSTFFGINFARFWDRATGRINPTAQGMQTADGVINRDAEGTITSIEMCGAEKMITRDAEGNVEAVDDGVRRITLQRDAEGNISGWLAEVL